MKHTLPPSQMLMHPGPGVDGPGPGVMTYQQPAMPTPAQASQIAFLSPEGMEVRWDVMAPGRFDSESLVVPARYNFPQGAIYRLKLSNIQGHPGVELYPTLEVGPAVPRTEAFLAHNSVPAQFTDEDFDQVLSGNFVTKVIYLPNPQFQELALAGVETLVSTRLEPGTDPIIEATHRGAILAVIRLGNKDLQVGGARYWRSRSDGRRNHAHRISCPHGLPRGLPDGRSWAPRWAQWGRWAAWACLAAMCRASPARNMGCRCAARPSDCPDRRTSRWECRPDCNASRSSTIRA